MDGFASLVQRRFLPGGTLSADLHKPRDAQLLPREPHRLGPQAGFTALAFFLGHVPDHAVFLDGHQILAFEATRRFVRSAVCHLSFGAHTMDGHRLVAILFQHFLVAVLVRLAVVVHVFGA